MAGDVHKEALMNLKVIAVFADRRPHDVFTVAVAGDDVLVHAVNLREGPGLGQEVLNVKATVFNHMIDSGWLSYLDDSLKVTQAGNDAASEPTV